MDDAVRSRRLKQLLDDAVAMLGGAMRERFEPGLVDALGPTWFKQVSPAQGRFAREDFSSYADCLLGEVERTRSRRELFRKIADRDWSDYGRPLQEAKKARNDIIHQDAPFDLDNAAGLMDAFARFAAAFGLPCAPELTSRSGAIRAGEVGQTDDSPGAAGEAQGRSPEVEEELHREREEKAALAAEVRDFNQRLAASDRALVEANEALASQSQLTDEMIAARESALEAESEARLHAENRLASASVDLETLERLEREKQASQLAAQEAQSRADAAQRKAEELHSERDELARREQDAANRILELEARERAASEPAGAEAPLASPLPTPDEERQAVRSDQASHTIDAPAELDQDFPSPGDPWPFPRGSEVFALSANAHLMIRLRDGITASALWSEPVAARAVDSFLLQRPEGGRVWIDEDDDAVTIVDGTFVYLGRMTDFSDDEAAGYTTSGVVAATGETRSPQVPSPAQAVALHSIRPGQKWPYGAGEFSYSLRRSARDVYEYESDNWLSDVVGKAKAHEVVDRLLEHRPEGGTIRVDADGDVSTQRKTGGGRFYLGRITSDEWFPNTITATSTAPAADQQTPRTSTPARVVAEHSIRPGRKWPYGAGEFSYSLRPWAHDVEEHGTGTWLSAVVGKETARKVVDRLGKHRREGGTIRVDDDGDVSTQRKTGGGRFYLGRVTSDEWFPNTITATSTAPAAARPTPRASTPARVVAEHSIRPGQQWPYGAGEFSYSLRRSARDVHEYESDTWLSDVVGKAKAHEVVDRLLEHRPEGGTIRVDADGDVSTQRKTGGGRFYLGRVTSDEWFPGVIDE